MRFEIIQKKIPAENTVLLTFSAPMIAAKAEPGQFVIVRPSTKSERIPLTIADFNRGRGEVTLIFQTVGSTTAQLGMFQKGDRIEDVVGPLGKATELSDIQKACVIGGGVGCAIAYPIAKKLAEEGKDVTVIAGFRGEKQVMLQRELAELAERFDLMTDDGTAGTKGNVCAPLETLLQNGEHFDRIFAIGPIVMMKAVTQTVKPYSLPCTVSLNPIMIDGTGMCGGCRVSILENGEKKVQFACVDGPDFDAYTVDFDELAARNRMYADFEQHKREETCRLLQQEVPYAK